MINSLDLRMLEREPQRKYALFLMQSMVGVGKGNEKKKKIVLLSHSRLKPITNSYIPGMYILGNFIS